jgi:hypothetical protein
MQGGEVIVPRYSLQLAKPYASTKFVIYVANLSGMLLGELVGTLQSVSWEGDGYGSATLICPPEFLAQTPWLFQYGNRVMIEFDNGLPAWGGFIDPPREISDTQLVVQMYEGGAILDRRETDGPLSYSGSLAKTASAILTDVVGRVPNLGIRPGYRSNDGRLLDVAFGTRKLLSRVAEQLRQRDPKMHWLVKPEWENRRIVFDLVTYYECLRDDVNRVVLAEGHNFASQSSLEQGPIINEFRVTPTETGDAAQDRDEQSVGVHGLRQLSVTLPSALETNLLAQAQQHAEGQVEAYSQPRLRTIGTALDASPALFRDYGVGTRLTLEMVQEGMSVREATVMTVEYVPGTGTATLVLDVAREDRL